MVEDVEHACAGHWPSLVLSNHDIERAGDRYAGARDRDAVAKLLGAMLLTLRGTPFLYYGEEIAMRGWPPEHVGEVQDPVGRRFWPEYQGRDGVRRPMQWESTSTAGFTTGTPWLRPAPDVRERNVARQERDGNSVLAFYRSMLRLRRASRALRDGTFRTVRSANAVFAYRRECEGERALVVLNFTSQPVHASLDLASSGLAPVGSAMISTHHRSDARADLRTVQLDGLEGVVFEC